MKNQRMMHSVDNPPIFDELPKRFSNDKPPITLAPKKNLDNDLHDIIEKHNEKYIYDFNNDINYRFEYFDLLKNEEKQYHWMSFTGNDSKWQEEMLHNSERD